MKYKLTFPSSYGNGVLRGDSRISVIQTLRDLCPVLSLKEIRDIVDQGGTQEVDVSDDLTSSFHIVSLIKLRENGVFYEGYRTIETDEPEPPTRRPVKTDTLDSLRCAAHDALDRGDHDIAIALIELIKKNS